MKVYRGFTLIEVVTALAVSAIILPVLGLVFYNMLVTPPEQSARLAINNDISILSSFLYDDVHRADSFTPGIFPYYGNFTFTDYSYKNIEDGFNEYLIMYYASCQNPDDPNCRNSVVREVILTRGILPEPTVTPPPWPTGTPPAPTPTGVAYTQTYTYCSGGGGDKVAWAKAWNASEWFDDGHPVDIGDFFDETGSDVATATTYNYAQVCEADGDSWSDPSLASPGFGVNSQLYLFQVYQERDDVTSLSVTWRGYGGDIDYGYYSTTPYSNNINLQIWDFENGEWDSLVSASDPGSKVNTTYNRPSLSDPQNYIDEDTSNVVLLASSDADEETPVDVDFGTSLYFNGEDNYVSTSCADVPANTFTFEAWVKAVNTHQVDAESTSGILGTSGQYYALWPTHGGASDAGAGLSVGTNGISVYEHGSSYMPAIAVYSGTLGTTWNHIAIVYDNKQPKIYLNGNLVRTGLTSTRDNVYAPCWIGYGGDVPGGPGDYGYFEGWIDEVRVWDVALTEEQIRDNMYREDPLIGSAEPVYAVEEFTSSGSFTAPAGVTEVQVLVVGGGGGGGSTSHQYGSGGGGGGGGVVYDPAYTVDSDTPVTVTVGAGGNGASKTSSANGQSGGQSKFDELTANGGGGGGGGGLNGTIGGSGGGGGVRTGTQGLGAAGIAGEGNAGGNAYRDGTAGRNAAGGGGGKSASGSNAVSQVGGNGGTGVNYNSIFGAVGGAGGWFGGGGGGGAYGTPGSGGSGGGAAGGNGAGPGDDGKNATANTGGGGGGAGGGDCNWQIWCLGCCDDERANGGNGGSGMVVVKYLVPTSGLVGYWKFNGHVYDSSGSGRDGTLSDPAPEYDLSLYRDLAIYTDYIDITIVTPEPTPEPTPTVPPAPTPTPTTTAFLASNSWQVPEGVVSVQVLVVGGGGGGGSTDVLNYAAGGGGGGGVIYDANYTNGITPGASITVTVGAGGAGAVAGANGDSSRGTNGGDSVFGTITAKGGGGGGGGPTAVNLNYSQGKDGGSGGGEGVQTTAGTSTGGSGTAGPPRQGYDGGQSYYGACECLFCLCPDRNSGGGGGGAGGLGQTAPNRNAGSGGIGYDASGVFGTGYGASGWFAGGGGGGSAGAGDKGSASHGGGTGGKGTDVAQPGSNNTGGGGGGAGQTSSTDRAGGNGGSGVVLVKYAVTYYTLYTGAGPGGNVSDPEPPGDNYIAMSNVDITAEADDDYDFSYWSGTGVDAGKVSNPNSASTSILLDNNYAVYANFAPKSGNFSLTLLADPAEGGSPLYYGSPPFEYGTEVYIYANPNSGYTFTGWTPTDGIADPSAAYTTVRMTVDREVTANFEYTGVPDPTPTPATQLGALYLTQYIAAADLTISKSGDLIIADMTAGTVSSMGKYLEKKSTLYLSLRPAYLLPERDFWGEDTVSTTGTFRVSGARNTISGDVKVSGTVTVESSADSNSIDGTLTCPEIVGDNQAKLSYTSRIVQTPDLTIPDMGDPQIYFATDLSLGVEVFDDVTREYVFTGNVNLGDVPEVWQTRSGRTQILKPGKYYSPGKITLNQPYTQGSVTFIANQIEINNTGASVLIQPSIKLGPYHEDLLFWAMGDSGNPVIANDGDILVRGSSTYHACASLEGALYAPNGEIELAGSGRTGWFGYTQPAELYNGAIVAQDFTLSGSHWNFYRW